MKIFIAFALAIFLCGCAHVSERQKTAIKVGTLIVAGGMIMAHSSGNDSRKKQLPTPACSSNPESCR